MSDDGTVVFDPPIVSMALRGLESVNRQLFPLDPGTDWIPFIAPGGVLDRLRLLADEVSSLCGWTADQAVVFVLTGLVPLIRPIQTGNVPSVLSRFPMRAPPWVVLKVDATVTPAELASFYREHRKDVLVGRHRDQGRKHLTLAVFASSRPPNETWANRLRAWNRRYPKWRYGSRANFCRDARRALARLVQVPSAGIKALHPSTPNSAGPPMPAGFFRPGASSDVDPHLPWTTVTRAALADEAKLRD